MRIPSNFKTITKRPAQQIRNPKSFKRNANRKRDRVMPATLNKSFPFGNKFWLVSEIEFFENEHNKSIELRANNAIPTPTG